MNGNTRVGANLAFISVGLIAVMVFVSLPASADRYSSSNYTIDASTMNTFGGTGSSTSYGLVSSGGEAVIGNGTGGSYKLGQGYIAQLEPDDPAMQIAVQPSGLAAYFPFEEGAGSVTNDSSANTTSGTLTDGPVWTTGKIGGALDFDGDDDFVSIPDSAALSPTAAITVSVWFNGSNRHNDLLSSIATIISKGVDVGDPADNPPYALFLIDGTIHFATENDAGDTITSAWSGIASDTWYHAVGTFDGTNQRLYVNGVLRDTDAQTDINDNNSTVRIGMQKDAYDRFYNGIVDEVKIYSRALSLAEIQYEYAAQNAGNRAGIGLGTITPGASQSVDFDTIVDTNVGEYTLAINQNQPLTNGGNTIPAISGSIASPALWSEGTTKGLGFTLVSGNSIPAAWSSGTKYAALPGSGTTFYTRTGGAGLKEVFGMRLKADVDTSQASGDYVNTMTIVGTTTP